METATTTITAEWEEIVSALAAEPRDLDRINAWYAAHPGAAKGSEYIGAPLVAMRASGGLIDRSTRTTQIGVHVHPVIGEIALWEWMEDVPQGPVWFCYQVIAAGHRVAYWRH